MKIMRMLCGVFLLVFGMAGIAGAVSFTDLQTGYNWLSSEGGKAERIFDLDNDILLVGDINAESVILPPVTLTIEFTDNDEDRLFEAISWEFANIYLDGTKFRDGINVDSGVKAFYGVGIWLGVVQDHYLSVVIENVSGMGIVGDFGVGNATLSGNYADHSAPVPEPATML